MNIEFVRMTPTESETEQHKIERYELIKLQEEINRMKRNEENTRMMIARLEDLGDFGKRAIAADQIRITADPNSENRSIKNRKNSGSTKNVSGKDSF